MKREPAEPQGFIKLTGVGIPRLQAGEDVNSHIQGRPCGPLLPMRMCCAFRSGRAATGAAASPGGCRAVGFCPCYKTSIDDANRIG